MTYKIIGWAAMITTPFAPATFFGWRVYSILLEITEGYRALSVVAAVCAVLGLEGVGILAGHTAVDAFRLKKTPAAIVASVVLMVYVVIGVWELWGTIGAVIFLIAPLAYIAVALRDTMHQIDSQQKQETAEKYNFRKAQLDAQLKLKTAEIQAKEAAGVEKARIKAETQQNATFTQLAPPARTLPNDWRKMTNEQRNIVQGMTNEEIMKATGVSLRTAQNWKSKG